MALTSGQNHLGKKQRNWRKGTEAGHVGGDWWDRAVDRTADATVRKGENLVWRLSVCVCVFVLNWTLWLWVS